jgi:hypothetical protein
MTPPTKLEPSEAEATAVPNAHVSPLEDRGLQDRRHRISPVGPTALRNMRSEDIPVSPVTNVMPAELASSDADTESPEPLIAVVHSGPGARGEDVDAPAWKVPATSEAAAIAISQRDRKRTISSDVSLARGGHRRNGRRTLGVGTSRYLMGTIELARSRRSEIRTTRTIHPR